MLVAHAAVAAAFIIIRKQGFDLRNAGENAITNQLEGVLRNDLLNRGTVEGFDRRFFGPVTRGSEVENYNGEKISKKPDLVFHLQRENALWDQRQDAIFAECKPVDRDHSLSANYCAVGTDRVGVERFVIGDYAWAIHIAPIQVFAVQDLKLGNGSQFLRPFFAGLPLFVQDGFSARSF
ncbi:MAG: hypothetical protein ACLQU4_12440 [Limisphaerales bacterium]